MTKHFCDNCGAELKGENLIFRGRYKSDFSTLPIGSFNTIIQGMNKSFSDHEICNLECLMAVLKKEGFN